MSATGTPSPGLVLVVEDNEVLCQTTTEILELAGYAALGVPDPEAAVPVLAQREVSLVLLDVGVDFTGVRLLADIADPTQVIMVSGQDDRRRAPRGGPIFLTKPVTPTQLLSEVERHLGAG